MNDVMKSVYNGPIIDFHIHPFGNEFYNTCFHKEVMKCTVEEWKEDMARCGITYCAGSVLTTVDRSPIDSFDTLRKFNDEALRLRELVGDMYIPGFHIHPDFMEESHQEIRRMEREGVILVGELVPYMHGWRYDNTAVYELYQDAGESGMVVSFHSANPEEMDEILRNCPWGPFVGAHPRDYEECRQQFARLKEFDNYYLDLSGTGLFRQGMLENGIRIAGGSEKILFGSDYPLTSPGCNLGAVMYENISEEERANILFNNAAKLLKIKA